MRQATVVLPHPLPVPTTAMIFTIPPAAPRHAAAALHDTMTTPSHAQQRGPPRADPGFWHARPLRRHRPAPGASRVAPVRHPREPARGACASASASWSPCAAAATSATWSASRTSRKSAASGRSSGCSTPSRTCRRTCSNSCSGSRTTTSPRSAWCCARPCRSRCTTRGRARRSPASARSSTAALAVPADEAEALLPDLARRAPAQAEALAGLCRAQGKPVPASSLNRAALEGLQKKGLVTPRQHRIAPRHPPPARRPRWSPRR